MASRALPVLPCIEAKEPERPPPALVSDVLEEIFLRVASPADLARASAACVSFHGVISNPSFLRRYRSVHPPLLVGFINRDGFHPVEATHPSAAIARGVARTVDISFLPHGPQGWCANDVRDGRVLVACWYRRRLREYCDLAVYDPLFRQFLLLPPMTDDLLASVGIDNETKNNYTGEASFIPCGGTEEDTSFSVICWMFSKTRLAVFIFSTKTSSAHWDAVKSISWADLGLPQEIKQCLNGPAGQCVYGCFYWKLYCRRELLKFDMDTFEFSKYELPPGHNHRSIVIVESGEGKVAMFSKLVGEGSVDYYTFMQNGADDQKSYKWHLKSTIPLSVHGPNFSIRGQAGGYVFLESIIEEQDKTYLEYFSLDIKSCNIERACRTSGRIISCPYFGYPPSMSPRRI
ncbi:hypothetical protein BDA96_08G184600 [Sorghum bicolor]|uniref:F-box domain-containing protein n=2 Tax=Sorghum bicolor TaxID=4558 RepID=A0A921U7J0_SORBI|nr:hypothetical protein SORBI_3008G167000 [Sorghum bicolor]KAG0521712.1 hypothetical protein BDA96_08G184600 [Sorghum bicolor]